MMNLINCLFFALLLTTLTGTVVFASWLLVRQILKRYGYCQYAYRYLTFVLPFWLLPVLYLYLFFRDNRYDAYSGSWWSEGVLFFATDDVMIAEQVFAVVWFLGALLMVTHHIRGYWRIIHKINRQAFLAGSGRQKIFADIKKKMQIFQRVELLECYGLESPFITSVFNPKIILPSCNYDKEELEAVIYHELIHVRQGVLFWKLAGFVIAAVHWFNPLGFFLNKELDRQAEIACDIQACFYEKGDYSTKKYFLVALQDESPYKMVAYTLFGKQNYIEERIMTVKKFKKKELNKAAMAGLAFLLLSGSTVTTYAASLGFEYVSNAHFDAVVEEVDETDKMDQYQLPEFEEQFDETAQNVEELEWVSVERSSSIQVDSSVSANTLKKGIRKYLNEGDKVSVTLSVSPDNLSVKTGLIQDSGLKTYVNGKDFISHVFTIKKSGYYTFFVENTNSKKVSVQGYVNFM